MLRRLIGLLMVISVLNITFNFPVIGTLTIPIPGIPAFSLIAFARSAIDG